MEVSLYQYLLQKMTFRKVPALHTFLHNWDTIEMMQSATVYFKVRGFVLIAASNSHDFKIKTTNLEGKQNSYH